MSPVTAFAGARPWRCSRWRSARASPCWWRRAPCCRCRPRPSARDSSPHCTSASPPARRSSAPSVHSAFSSFRSTTRTPMCGCSGCAPPWPPRPVGRWRGLATQRGTGRGARRWRWAPVRLSWPLTTSGSRSSRCSRHSSICPDVRCRQSCASPWVRVSASPA